MVRNGVNHIAKQRQWIELVGITALVNGVEKIELIKIEKEWQVLVMKTRIKERIVNYVISNYTLLDDNKFINGKTYFNRKCHLNSVQEAIDNNYDVLLTICIGNGEVFVHFINVDLKGKYIDSTLGWYGKELYDYYLIRKIDKREYKTIWQNLINTKKMLINLNSNWLERKLGFIKEDDV